MNEFKDYWDKTHKKYYTGNIVYDNWLDDYKNIINSTKKPIIDLGCGEGNNTKYLTEMSKQVIACDFSDSALDIIKDNFSPNLVTTKKFDMSKGFPFKNNFVDLVIADLSLHYFDTKTTLYILSELKRIITSDGHLIFRVNSIKDTNYGSNNGKFIEKNYYFTDGYNKRFFEESDFNKFFKDFDLIELSEDTMERYGPKKILWKGLARNS